MTIGSDVLGWVFVDDFELVRDLSVIALIIILFEGGLTTKPSALREAGLPGFVLANLAALARAWRYGAGGHGPGVGDDGRRHRLGSW